MIIWLDIETLPGLHKPDHTSIEPPANYTKPETIERYQLDQVDKAWKEQALNSMQGRIACISWAVGATPVVCHGAWERSEKDILTYFDEVVGEQDGVTWAGFNIRAFDLNWIWQRALKYDLANLLDNIKRDRFAKNVLDIREVWTGGDARGKGKLKEIADFLGIEHPDCDGSEVLALWEDKEFDKLAAYNISDVEITRQIAWRMNVGNPPFNDPPRPTKAVKSLDAKPAQKLSQRSTHAPARPKPQIEDPFGG